MHQARAEASSARARGTRDEGHIAAPDAPLYIRPRAPFSFAQTLRFILSPPPLLNGRKFEPLLDYFVDGEYRRVVDVGGQPVLYGVRDTRQGAEARLSVRVLAGSTDDATRQEVRSLVERQFSTDLDLGPFYRPAKLDAVLRKLVESFRGMRIPQAPTVFETLVSAILEQQVNLTFAHQVKKALIETYGSAVEFEGRRYNSFPEPAALAITSARELRRIQVSGPKATYVIKISRAVLDGSLDLEALRRLDPAVARERLLQHKGVGPWTAEYVGLRALGHLDSLPAADVGLQRAIQFFYGLRKQPTAARVTHLARRWAGWRSCATVYLWRTFWEGAEWRLKVRQEIRGAPKDLQRPRRAP